MQEYLSVGDAAKRLGVVPATVKLMVRGGKLRQAARTAGGLSLFDPAEVGRLAEVRAAHRERRTAGAPMLTPAAGEAAT